MGVVTETGPAVSRVSVGDRVVVMPQNGCGMCDLCLSGEHIHCRRPLDPLAICECSSGRGTYADHCIQQDWLLLPVPDDVSDDHAAMACCGLGPTFNAMRAMDVCAYDTVLIAGLGPVGLGGVINATHLGARVIGLDMNPFRSDLAKRLGAETVIDPTSPDALDAIRSLTGGHGADAAVETTNVAASPSFLVEALRPKGRLGLVSWTGDLSVPKIVGKGLSTYGCWHWNHLRDAERMFDCIRRNGAKLDGLITHRFSLSGVEQAWRVQMTGACGKVILHP
jgi:threonine dehydrogenase-like Zn-dependent dehydrogenase